MRLNLMHEMNAEVFSLLIYQVKQGCIGPSTLSNNSTRFILQNSGPRKNALLII